MLALHASSRHFTFVFLNSEPAPSGKSPHVSILSRTALPYLHYPQPLRCTSPGVTSWALTSTPDLYLRGLTAHTYSSAPEDLCLALTPITAGLAQRRLSTYSGHDSFL